MAKGTHWKQVLSEYKVKVNAGSTNQKACVTKSMAAINKLVGATQAIVGAPRIITGERINSNVIRSRTV